MIKRIDFTWSDIQYKDYIILEFMEDVWEYIEGCLSEEEKEIFHKTLLEYLDECFGLDSVSSYIQEHSERSGFLNLSILMAESDLCSLLEIMDSIGGILGGKFKNFVKYSGQGQVILINKMGGYFNTHLNKLSNIKILPKIRNLSKRESINKKEFEKRCNDFIKDFTNSPTTDYKLVEEIINDLGFVKTHKACVSINGLSMGLEEIFESSVYTCATIRFIYCTKSRRVYEIINEYYKQVSHRDIICHFKLDENYCYKLDINTEYGRYRSFKPYMGIRWLRTSDIYNALPHVLGDLEERCPLSFQDLERIEQYVDNERKKFVRKSIELNRIYGLEEDIELLGK